MNIRTRFAPSPTGYLHVGGVRTALFAWLVAEQGDGAFILRLEDTDKAREVEGADEHLMKSLKALGLTYHEGPDIGGPHAPYRQSERLAIYQEWAKKLLEAGRAYVDPYSSEEVQAFREQAIKEKCPFLYRNHRPEQMDTNWDGSRPLRFKSEPKAYQWHDVVMGNLKTGEEVVDDFILIKSDGYPTYNFAHIVDDTEMEISHIIRGQEFIASMPNYLNLYEALNLTPPIIASVPHIMNENGNKKLSKRDGAKDSLEYIKQGIPVPAFINFIATLGWNDGSEQEIFSIDELVAKFSLNRVQNSGARFDERRLLWISGAHIRSMDREALYQEVATYWPSAATNYDDLYKMKVLGLVQERLKYYGELSTLTEFFFIDLPINPELISTHKQLKNMESESLKKLLELAKQTLEALDLWDAPTIQNTLNELLEKTNEKPVVLFSLIRIATTQSPASPSLAESLELLTKDRVLHRIDQQLEAFATST